MSRASRRSRAMSSRARAYRRSISFRENMAYSAWSFMAFTASWLVVNRLVLAGQHLSQADESLHQHRRRDRRADQHRRYGRDERVDVKDRVVVDLERQRPKLRAGQEEG